MKKELVKLLDYKEYDLNAAIMFLGNIQEIKPNRFLINYGVAEEKYILKEIDIKENKNYMTLYMSKNGSFKIIFTENLD